MAGPPNNIEPSELWAKLCSAERPSKVVDFPRYDDSGKSIGEIRIRILTQKEKSAAAIDAHDFTSKFLKDVKRTDLAYERVFADANVIETLFRACRKAENAKEPAFRSPNEMREVFTTEECMMLFEHYLTVQVELGPMAKTMMSEEEMEAWICRLEEGGHSANPLNLLSWEQQTLLLMYLHTLVCQYRNSLKEQSSAGEPLSEQSTASGETPPEEQMPLVGA